MNRVRGGVGQRRTGHRWTWVPVALLAVVGLPAATTPIGSPIRVSLDAAGWRAAPATGVALQLAAARGPEGGAALRLDWDFQGHGGWAAVRHPLPLELPPHYELRFRIRGSGPPNRLEVKLVDPSGDNVWWHVEPDVAWPAGWTPMRVRQRQIGFAWGPLGGGTPRRLGALELAVTAGRGGQGWIEIADLEIVPVAAPRPPVGPPQARAGAALPGHPAARVLDGDHTTSWQPGPAGGTLTVDLRGDVELGGLSLYWAAGKSPQWARVELSKDGTHWHAVRRLEPSGAAASHLRLPDTQARAVRVTLDPAACPEGCGLAELVFRPLDFGASANDFFSALAAEAPLGTYPRGFSGQAVYWTVVGVDGADAEALFTEDGVLGLGAGQPSLEPFVWLDGRLWSWADVSVSQSLAEGDLPIPTVRWPAIGSASPPGGAANERSRFAAVLPTGEALQLEVTVLAAGRADSSSLLARYRLTNRSAGRRRGRLLLTARPFQADPPVQSLNLAGGVAPIEHVGCVADGLAFPGTPRVFVAPAAERCGAQPFDAGPISATLASGGFPTAASVDDPVKAASAALSWSFDLTPGEELSVVVGAPFTAEAADALERVVEGGSAAFEASAVEVAEGWRKRLGRVKLELPPQAGPLAATLRSSVAWNLIHRDGPALEPGSRAYARSWIRDGALTGDALLRLGQDDVVARYARWFAGFQYPDGAVPCCVDRRGADPVPEHDSHGELIHLIAQLFRYTRDRGSAEEFFPHVVAAVDHIEALTAERRTPAFRQGEKRLFYGLLPESISHEGYSAHPVHSYWDDAWAYRGLADAADLAAALGRSGQAAEWGERRDAFRRDLLASIERVRAAHGLAVLPGSADLADFDPTASTILLEPGGLLPFLPRPAVEATFERYWQDWRARRSGARDWDAYTPYEIRNVGAFVRLGWRRRALELLAGFLADRRPPGWNGWPEVVTRDPRERRFLGDLPHGWVASDYIRSVLDLFTYEERQGGSLVLAAGLDPAWLVGAGVAIHRLRTPWGELGFRLVRHGSGVRYTLDPGNVEPPGGIALSWPLAGRVGGALLEGEPLTVAAGGVVRIPRVRADRTTVVDLLPEADDAARAATGGLGDER